MSSSPIDARTPSPILTIRGIGALLRKAVPHRRAKTAAREGTPRSAKVAPAPVPFIEGPSQQLCHRAALSDQVLLQKGYQGIARRQLLGRLKHFFTEFTGLNFEILWLAPAPLTVPLAETPSGCPADCSHPPSCPFCRGIVERAPKGADLPSPELGEGECWTCPTRHGFRNFRIPLRIRNVPLGTIVIQATGTPRRAKRKPPFPFRYPTSPPVANTAQFRRASHLLQFVVQHAMTSALAEIQQEELGQARQADALHERDAAHAHHQLHRIHPAAFASHREGQSASAAPSLVHRMLDYIHTGYARPISLKQFATQSQMNAAYLSTVFSTGVGIPFKHYLTDFRIEKARDLLHDPAHHISDVAYAVGYSDANRFKAAFKSITGLCPTSYRTAHPKT